MNARFQQVFSNLIGFFAAQPPARRVSLVVVALGSVGLVLGVTWWVQQPIYRPLFTNLSPDDAGAIVEALKGQKVPFQLEDGGRAVLVPSERLYEMRLTLASKGLPEGGGVGFELFDRQTLGQTDFLQRLNYQRALQGELARTIGQLGGVESARVHLALPERSLFVAQNRRPSASVVVKLAQGRTLSRGQIDGIVHLVAASVEGLEADAVTVVDEGGRILTSDRQGPDTAGVSGQTLEYQQSFERSVEDRVESMLGAVVGRERVIARVSATLDFARVERTEETFDPDKTAVRSAHTTKESSTSGRGAGGAPGVQSNLTNDAAATAGGEAPKSERKDETQAYEVSKTISRTVAPVGAVKALSVAVMIDGTYAGEGDQRKFTPRPQEELDRLKELVKNAVGFNEDRGDKIEVSSVAFQTETLPPGEGIMGTVLRWVPPVATRLLGVAFAAFMLLNVIRPMILALGAPREGGFGTGRVAGGDGAAAAVTRENQTLTRENPERAAALIREWLLEGPGGTQA